MTGFRPFSVGQKNMLSIIKSTQLYLVLFNIRKETYHVPGTVVGAENTEVIQTDVVPSPHRAHSMPGVSLLRITAPRYHILVHLSRTLERLGFAHHFFFPFSSCRVNIKHFNQIFRVLCT